MVGREKDAGGDPSGMGEKFEGHAEMAREDVSAILRT